MTFLLSPPAFPAQEASVTRLKNGFSVLVKKDERFPLACLRLYVQAGSAFEEKKFAGISHLLEHMVFKKTEKRRTGRIAQEVESVGGYLNASTSFDLTVYQADLPAAHWRLGLDVLKDMVFGAVIDEADLESEKKVVLSELEKREDEPASRIFEIMQEKIWSGTGYARPIIGFRDTVSAITAQDIRDYIARFYQPQTMLLAVSGDIDPDEVLKEARKLFGPLENTRELSPPAPVALLRPSPAKPEITVVQGPWNRAYMAAAFPLPGFRSPDSPGLDVLAYLLGGGKTSRFYRKFKYETGLVHAIHVSAMTLERTGMFYVFAALDQDKLDPFLESLFKDMASLKGSDFTDKEIARAKLNIEDSLFRTKETLSGLTSKLASFQFFEGRLDAEEQFLFSLHQVDKELIQDLITTYLDPAEVRGAVLTPDSNGLDPEKILARVDSIRPKRTMEAEAAQKKAKPGQTETIDIGRGGTLILIKDRTLPYASLNIVFQGGDSLLSSEEQGLADLCARLLTKGTGRLSGPELDNLLADRTARVTAYSNREAFNLGAKFPTRFSPEILGLIKDILTDPAFSEGELAREKANQAAAIKAREDRPLGLAFRRLFPFLFRTPPYSYLRLGRPDEIKDFGPDQIKAFWNKQKNSHWTMAVCGDFDRRAVLDLAEELKQGGVGADGPAAPFIDPAWSEVKSKDLKLAERNQAHLILAFKTPGMDHPDTPALTLLKDILSGQSGMLFDLREKGGLAYSVTAFLWQSPKTGFLAFYIGTHPDKVDQALEGFKQVADSLNRDELPPSEVERGINLLQGEYYRNHQTLDSRSLEAAELKAQGLGIDFNRRTIKRAGKLSAADLKVVAKKYLVWDDAYLLRVLP